jgi:hypothetical protein
VLVAAEEALSQELRALAAERRTRIVAVPTSGLSADEANRAIALAACEATGRFAQSAPMQAPAAAPDIGSFSLATVHAGGKRIRFANAFACNDAVSLNLLWKDHADADTQDVVLLNHRHDRPLRSLQLLDYFAQQPARPLVLLMGGSCWLRRAARKRGLEAQSISGLPWAAGRALLERVAARVPDGSTVWGVGNYHGRGAAISRTIISGTPCSS